MIAIIRSQFSQHITNDLERSALEVLEGAGVPHQVIRVPGAVELPVTAQKVITELKPTVVLALGCVIRGESDHYQYVLQSVTDGLTRVSLDTATPIIQGIIPAPHRKTAENRRHMGGEWAQSALSMHTLFSSSLT